MHSLNERIASEVKLMILSREVKTVEVVRGSVTEELDLMRDSQKGQRLHRAERAACEQGQEGAGEQVP